MLFSIGYLLYHQVDTDFGALEITDSEIFSPILPQEELDNLINCQVDFDITKELESEPQEDNEDLTVFLSVDFDEIVNTQIYFEFIRQAEVVLFKATIEVIKLIPLNIFIPPDNLS
ncbi:MAG: hypothetical protein ACFCUU_01695 [Cyclobacteriaceae bacterium]